MPTKERHRRATSGGWAREFPSGGLALRFLVTGGCGFIGSNFVRTVLDRRPEARVRVLDLLTYAGNLRSLSDVAADPRFEFVQADIVDGVAVEAALEGVDVLVNFAAESHVDRSILDAAPFIRTNVVGTQVLLDAVRVAEIGRFVQISTDEVYGSLDAEDAPTTEASPLAPNSPYSASKAGADCLVRAQVRTYGLDAVVVRSSNAYGPFQFPEKLIPLMIENAKAGRPLPVYGDGLHVRDWLHVLDLCEAVLLVCEDGVGGEIYNVGGGNQTTNLEIVRRIVELVGASDALVRFVEDRPGHDRRYHMDHTKITSALGWRPTRSIEAGLAETVDWYGDHADWVESVTSGAYRDYYRAQYGARLAASGDQPREPAEP